METYVVCCCNATHCRPGLFPLLKDYTSSSLPFLVFFKSSCLPKVKLLFQFSLLACSRFTQIGHFVVTLTVKLTQSLNQSDQLLLIYGARKSKSLATSKPADSLSSIVLES